VHWEIKVERNKRREVGEVNGSGEGTKRLMVEEEMMLEGGEEADEEDEGRRWR